MIGVGNEENSVAGKRESGSGSGNVSGSGGDTGNQSENFHVVPPASPDG